MPYDFISPGSAIHDAMERLLLQRAVQQRQAMQDQIAQKQAASQEQDRIANRDIQRANAASMDAQRQAVDDERKQKMAGVIATTLAPHQPLNPGTSADLTAGGLGHLVAGELPSADIKTSAPMTMPDAELPAQEGVTPAPTVTETPLAGQQTYTGTPDQIKKQDDRQKFEAYVKSLPPDSPEAKALNYEMMTGKSAPAGMFDKPAKQPTGMVAEYEYYVEQAKAAGQKPMSFEKYQDEDANRKRPVTPSEPPPSLGSQALDMAAKMYAKTGQLPAMGLGAAAAAVRANVINRAAQYDPGTDSFNATTGPDIASAKAEFGADSGSLVALQKNLDAATAFSKTADANAARLKSVMARVPDTGIPFLNRPVRDAARALGDTTMSELDAIRQSVNNEYARIISNPNLVGVLSDSARREMEGILSPNATVQQITKALEQLGAEAHNRVTNYTGQLGEIKDRIKNQGRGAAPTGAPGVIPVVQPKSKYKVTVQ